MSRLNPLSLIVSLAVSPSGLRIELEGGHVFEYRRREEPSRPPSLPPPTFDTTAEVVPLRPLAKARPTGVVIPLRRTGTGGR